MKAEKAAAAKFAEGFEHIKTARKVILDIARVLPSGLREKIAVSIRSLSGAIIRLERYDPSKERRKNTRNAGEQRENDEK